MVELTYKDYDNCIADLKAAFPQHKTYNLRRGQQREAVMQLVHQHGMRVNLDKSGWVMCTPSISFSWTVYEQDDTAVFFYKDGGMGWDTVMLMSKNKIGLESMRQTGIALGIVKLRNPK